MKASIRVFIGHEFKRINVEFSVNPITSNELYRLVSADEDGADIPVDEVIRLNPGLDGLISLEHLGGYAMEVQGVDLTKKPRKRKPKPIKHPGHPTLI